MSIYNVLSLGNGGCLGCIEDNRWHVEGRLSGAKAGVAGRHVGEEVVGIAYGRHDKVEQYATLAARMRAGGKVVVLVTGVFGGPSSGGTAVPGLEPTLPALVVGEVDRSGVMQTHNTMLGKRQDEDAVAGCRKSVPGKRSGRSRARLGI